MPRPKNNREVEAMRRMIHQHFQRRAMIDPPAPSLEAHLDDDALNAFVEGRLTVAESAPLIRHLVACALCRRITAQLIRLEADLKTKDAPMPVVEPERGRISRLLEDLASRVLPSSTDEAVFAYHAPAEDFQPKGQAGDEQETESAPDENGETKTDNNL